MRRSTTRATARRSAPKAAAKKRVASPKAQRPKAKRAVAKKTVAKKVTKGKVAPKKKLAAKVTAKSKSAAATRVKVKSSARNAVAKKPLAGLKLAGLKKAARKERVAPAVKKTQKLAAVRAQRPAQVAPTPPRQPTVAESAALKAFERAHKEFMHGRFGEARNQFRVLLEKYSQVSEVAARVRTYLAVSESRLRTETMLPRDADSLYDRGVIELNRGEYVAAQEMFERALKREPEAAHIHYGLAATRARLGALDLALQSLQRAIDLQPTLRVRAQHDHDLTSLRNDPDFDRLVFQPRP
ncbi:MAG TPA: tetratricopeptide repeat protein [Pyrinomonadaceae bacterium]|nr:tetratricopeptide repeat protein [Pyrinomonadaceae bacterium]